MIEIILNAGGEVDDDVRTNSREAILANRSCANIIELEVTKLKDTYAIGYHNSNNMNITGDEYIKIKYLGKYQKLLLKDLTQFPNIKFLLNLNVNNDEEYADACKFIKQNINIYNVIINFHNLNEYKILEKYNIKKCIYTITNNISEISDTIEYVSTKSVKVIGLCVDYSDINNILLSNTGYKIFVRNIDNIDNIDKINNLTDVGLYLDSYDKKWNYAFAVYWDDNKKEWVKLSKLDYESIHIPVLISDMNIDKINSTYRKDIYHNDKEYIIDSRLIFNSKFGTTAVLYTHTLDIIDMNCIDIPIVKYNEFNKKYKFIKHKQNIINADIIDILQQITEIIDIMCDDYSLLNLCDYMDKISSDDEILIKNLIEESIFGFNNTPYRSGLDQNLYTYKLIDQLQYLYNERAIDINDEYYVNYANHNIIMLNDKYPVVQSDEITIIDNIKYCVVQVPFDFDIDNNKVNNVSDENDIILVLPKSTNDKIDYYKLKETYNGVYTTIKYGNYKYKIPLNYQSSGTIRLSKYLLVVNQNNKWVTLESSNNNCINLTSISETKNIWDIYKVNAYHKLPILHEKIVNGLIPDIDINIDAIQHIRGIKTDKLNVQLKFEYDINELNSFGHRSGWKCVINEISKINNNESENIVQFIDLIEKNFGWDYIDQTKYPTKEISFNDKNYIIPMNELKMKNNSKKNHVALINDNKIIVWDGKKWVYDPHETLESFSKLQSVCDTQKMNNWIGIWHNPHNMPEWFDYHHSPQSILKTQYFQDSLINCKGIIVLSNYFKNWVKQHIPSSIPISVLYHPTESVNLQFNFDNFLNNQEKCIIQIGYWLRNMYAIGMLKTNMYKKIWLYGNDWAHVCLQKELQNASKKDNVDLNDKVMKDVIRLRVDNKTYDHLLSENICFINLYDSSANNAVIECIARKTPLLINKHPAIVEYLGEDYPFYYDTLEQAALMAEDFDLIKKTHEYLVSNNDINDQITYERFINDFMNCEVIKNLFQH